MSILNTCASPDCVDLSSNKKSIDPEAHFLHLKNIDAKVTGDFYVITGRKRIQVFFLIQYAFV